MSLTRRLILAIALIAGITPAFAQAPPPVPALPDSERRTSYSISGTTCACNVGFALYGDSTDVANWLEVFINGVLITQSGNWGITSPTGPIATIPRPITDAVLTFTAVQTGTVQIVGARRPRRTSQFQESQPVPTRNFNQVFSDIIATQRELWDKTNDFTGRGVFAPPGETLALLPILATRANQGACFNAGGNLVNCVSIPSSTFIAGANIQFTGSNPTTISGTGYLAGNGILFTGSNPVTITNNIAAGANIAITGTNPLTIASTTTTNAFAVNHTIATTDCFAIVQMGTGSTWPLTLTLPAGTPASNGFTGPCPISVVGQASRGVKLSGFSGLGLTSPSILWPTKSFSLAIASGGASWLLTGDDGRWAKQNLTINIDSGGADTNDGLATGTTNAIQHLDACRNIAQNYIDTQSSGNGGLTCLAPSGQSFQEFVQVFFPLTGGGTLIFQGSGGAFNWVPANGTYAIQFGDLGVVGFTNVNFTTTGSTTPAGLVLGHNYGVADFNTGVTFTASSPAVTFAMDCDFDSHFNINNGFGYIGTFTTALFRACQNSSWNFNNAINSTGSTSLGRQFNIFAGSRVSFGGNVTWGTTGLSTTVGLVTGNSVLNSLGGVPPGGAPTPTTGGQYCTSLC